ncbi:hypothetical protein cyc_07600 [Cyclospora cayetanensis]|uniref:Uncharacterized protein n=1 Tax=Cyclospora cayetanensis TaxID=88456 RepID=A0A1D3DA21_9EIME|nr:hypothetical protein cyc_07600 [Cyclospora cayetanensis]
MEADGWLAGSLGNLSISCLLVKLDRIPGELQQASESAIFKEQLQHDLGVLQLSPYAAPTCGLVSRHHSPDGCVLQRALPLQTTPQPHVREALRADSRRQPIADEVAALPEAEQ